MAGSARPWRWLYEWVSPGEYVARSVARVYYSGSTGLQGVDVVELAGLGKALVLDGKVQSSLLDEHWYHEALVHPVLLSHPCPRRVLVLGGGEGATLREVLKHRCVEKAVMVDIDAGLVELSKKLLGEWHRGAFDDPRVELVIGDGRRFVEEAGSGEFDAAILDLVDPMEGGPAAKLYTLEFYREVRRVVGSSGVMVTQAESPTLTPRVHAVIANTVSKAFKRTAVYITYVRSYNGLWGFAAGSDKYSPADLDPAELGRLIEERIEGELRFYDPETHRWMFSLPKPIRSLLEEEESYATDDNPVYVE